MLDAFRYLLYMLALCLMLLGTYYAQNYAGIIGRSLVPAHVELFIGYISWCVFLKIGHFFGVGFTEWALQLILQTLTLTIFKLQAVGDCNNRMELVIIESPLRLIE